MAKNRLERRRVRTGIFSDMARLPHCFQYLVFALLLAPQLSLASIFDAEFDPCLKRVSTAQLRLEKENLLQGDHNFILFKPHTDNSVYYELNCPRRVFALEVIKDPNAKTETLSKALDVIAYQSTFSPEAATGLIEFLKTSKNEELRELAAKAFYFLHDIFPNIGIHADYYKKAYFINFYRSVLSSEKNKEVAFWLAQVPQKVGGYFYSSQNFCYRDHLLTATREIGEALAKVFTPLIVDALNLKLAKGEDNELIRNELIVALNNFSYSRFIKYDQQTLKKLATYFKAEKEESFRVRVKAITPINDYLTGQRKLEKTIPDQDQYCPVAPQ